MRLTDHIREREQRIDGLQDEVRRVRAASPRASRGAAPWT
jgi:uncharacterized small protein (DUF1192 family)